MRITTIFAVDRASKTLAAELGIPYAEAFDMVTRIVGRKQGHNLICPECRTTFALGRGSICVGCKCKLRAI